MQHDEGGYIDHYNLRWAAIAGKDGPGPYPSMCQSACTLVTSHIPKYRLCFAEYSYLNFNQARLTHGGPPAPEATKAMFNSYPADIRGWLVAKGGLDTGRYRRRSCGR